MIRALGFVSLLIVIAVGMDLYFSQLANISPAPTAHREGTVNMVAVQNDLLAIARAERDYAAETGSYASLEQLLSGNYLTIPGKRPPYSYQVDTSSSRFRVTATRMTPGSPAQLWIDDTMEIHTSP